MLIAPTWWDVLEGVALRALPELIARRHVDRELVLWVPACGDGLGVYTLAATAMAREPALAGWRWSVLGTDITPAIFPVCAEGRYGASEFRRWEDEAARDLSFVREGGTYRVREELRRHCYFATAEDWQATRMPGVDLVLLDDWWSAEDIERTCTPWLASDGWIAQVDPDSAAPVADPPLRLAA